MAVAFAHEDPTYRGWVDDGPRSYERVLDMLDQADVRLEEMRDDARRRRRKPTYWGDRVLRAVLGFPGYLLSLALGVDRNSLSARQTKLLWYLSILADIGGVIGLVVFLTS